MISRRHLLAALPALLASAALGQDGTARRRIGVLSLSSVDNDPRLQQFRSTLAALGYVEGKNIRIEWRSSEDRAEQLPTLVNDLLEHRVEVIVAAQTQAIEAARRQTSTVPIVFVAAYDPVGSGFAQSLARPGLNMTGVANNVADLAPRQIELIRLAVPHLRRLGLVLNPRNRATAKVRREYEAAATREGIELNIIQANTAEQLLGAVGTARSLGVQAVVVQADGIFFLTRNALVQALAAQKLPAIFTQVENVEAGGLMSYGPEAGENFRRCAHYVDRLLKGAKAAELPIEHPTRIELSVNTRAAKALGLALPDSLLKQAVRVIR